jgi:hypothetical protein
MAESTHALALATSQCLFKMANTSKLSAHSITLQQIARRLHRLLKLLEIRDAFQDGVHAIQQQLLELILK